MIPDSPHDLVGQRIDFIINIVRAYDLPINFCKDVFIEYTFYLDNEKYETIKIQGKNCDPIFDYRFHHTVEFCSETFIEYLLKDSVINQRLFVYELYRFALNYTASQICQRKRVCRVN